MTVIESRIGYRFATTTCCLAMLLLSLVLGVSGATCNAQSAAGPSCQNSTVDVWGTDFAARARLFLTDLQGAITRDDKMKFASLAQYPLLILQGNHTVKVATQKALMRRYQAIMKRDFKRQILAQSPECLFANAQGVMIGNGQIWFQEQSGGQMKIITINLSVPFGSN